MNFLTVREISSLWGISTRRVALLAANGRIEGAKLIGNHWLIPESAAKPSDPRKKVKNAPVPTDDNYIFPFLLCYVNSFQQINGFSSDEKKLYQLGIIYERGEFLEARTLAEALLNSKSRYIQLGALYLLPTICMYLYDFEATQRYYLLFTTAVNNENTHREELDLLLYELDSEFISVSEFAKNISTVKASQLSDSLLPMFTVWKLLADLTAYSASGIAPNIEAYEVICRMVDSKGFFFVSALMHAYLSIYYGTVKDTENEISHLKRAIDISLERKTFFTIAYTASYNPHTAETVLRNYPPSVAKTFTALNDIFTDARNKYAEYQGDNPSLDRLTKDDYKLIALCFKGYSVSEMAEVFGLTKSGINKRLSYLYKKLGVKSKSEMSDVYLKAMLDWGK